MPSSKKPISRKKIVPRAGLTRGGKVVAFIEKYCRVPEGSMVGKPLVLTESQRKFIFEVYDNPKKTRMAILSVGRKFGKSTLIACILLAHLAGSEARQNTQLVSGALSRDQAALVFGLASKMVMLSPELSSRVRIVPSGKKLVGLSKNTEYRALAADGGRAMGLSPQLVIFDELGSVKGAQSDFYDALSTSQGAHEDPLFLVISTQAPTDADLLSILIDSQRDFPSPHVVSHVHSAPEGCDVMDESAWLAANPNLGGNKSLEDHRIQAQKAKDMPSSENSFRNLMLNQRVNMIAPFVSPTIWKANGSPASDDAFKHGQVFGGLDLSMRNDLTALCLAAYYEGKWHLRLKCWSPEDTLDARAKTDRAPYRLWQKQGFLTTIAGKSLDYDHLAVQIHEFCSGVNVQQIAFDRWNIENFRSSISRVGVNLPELVEMGQGFQSFSPAISSLETALLNEKVCHGGNPLLTMAISNVRVDSDPAGNRKFMKNKSTGRIDPAVALVMAIGIGSASVAGGDWDDFLNTPLVIKF